MTLKKLSDKAGDRVMAWTVLLIIGALFSTVALISHQESSVGPQEAAVIRSQVIAQVEEQYMLQSIGSKIVFDTHMPYEDHEYPAMWQEICRIQNNLGMAPALQCIPMDGLIVPDMVLPDVIPDDQ